MTPPGNMAYYKTYMNLVFEVDFLSLSAIFSLDHFFQVKIGSTLSDFHVQENGFPQGSILSPVLFDIEIAVVKDCASSLFVDAFTL